MAGVDRRIAECTCEELKRLDVGMTFSPRWMGQRIPTLQEVARFVQEGKKLFIEVKSGHDTMAPIKAALDEVQTVAPPQVTVMAFSREVIAASKALMPDVKTHWLTEDVVSSAEILSVLHAVGADGVGCARSERIDADFVRAVTGEGKELNVWTVDDIQEALRLRDCGITYLTTNRPGWMRQELERMG